MSDAKDNSMEFTVVVRLPMLRDSETPISIVSVNGIQADFNHGRDSGEEFHDRKIVQLPDGTVIYLALRETKVPKGTRMKPLPQPEFSDDLYESESSEDPDSVNKLIPCDTLYATLLASGEAKEPQGHGAL
jgi:hypothetical protein